jgi:cell wall-associated NlpC family hydrolase
MIPSWAREYIGIPFRSNGRDRSGCDCWGLTRLVQREVFGKELPSFADRYTDSLDRETVEILIDEYRPLLLGEKIDTPDIGDITVLLFSGHRCHLAIYVGDGKVLHTDCLTDSCLELLDGATLMGRLAGFYRVR